ASEKEELVFDDGAGNHGACIVELVLEVRQCRIRRRRIFFLGTHSIENLIADEITGGSVHVIGAGLHRHIHYARARESLRSVAGGRSDFELLYTVHQLNKARLTVGLDGHSIQKKSAGVGKAAMRAELAK